MIQLVSQLLLYDRPQDVIIFMVGGTTYEEARTIALLNQESGGASGGTRLLLGGTCVHNSSRFVIDYIIPFIYSSLTHSYLEMCRSAAASFSTSIYEPPPESASTAPALNLNLGGVNVSLGGANTGVYRSSGEEFGVQADGIRDGVRDLFGKLKQGVDRIGLQ